MFRVSRATVCDKCLNPAQKYFAACSYSSIAISALEYRGTLTAGGELAQQFLYAFGIQNPLTQVFESGHRQRR
jgi:hypothetical protein